MNHPTTHPGWPDNPTHPIPAHLRAGGLRLPAHTRLVLSDAQLARLAAERPGAVPARIELRWPIQTKDGGTATLIAEARSRVSRLGDRYGFTVLTEHWDFEDDLVLQLVAAVLWWPAGAAVERLVLDDAELAA